MTHGIRSYVASTLHVHVSIVLNRFSAISVSYALLCDLAHTQTEWYRCLILIECGKNITCVRVAGSDRVYHSESSGWPGRIGLYLFGIELTLAITLLSENGARPAKTQQ